MFYYLTGTLSIIDENRVAIDCGGVGYLVYTGLSTRLKIKDGEITRIYTHAVIREDAFDIYGFHTLEEIDMFRLLISVSGIGPRTALGVMSALKVDAIAKAVVQEDYKTLRTAPGIGQKAAQRIVLELSGKLNDKFFDEQDGAAEFASRNGGEYGEARDALVALGYTRQDAENALKKIDTASLTVEEMIRHGLRELLR